MSDGRCTSGARAFSDDRHGNTSSSRGGQKSSTKTARQTAARTKGAGKGQQSKSGGWLGRFSQLNSRGTSRASSHASAGPGNRTPSTRSGYEEDRNHSGKGQGGWRFPRGRRQQGRDPKAQGKSGRPRHHEATLAASAGHRGGAGQSARAFVSTEEAEFQVTVAQSLVDAQRDAVKRLGSRENNDLMKTLKDRLQAAQYQLKEAHRRSEQKAQSAIPQAKARVDKAVKAVADANAKLKSARKERDVLISRTRVAHAQAEKCESELEEAENALDAAQSEVAGLLGEELKVQQAKQRKEKNGDSSDGLGATGPSEYSDCSDYSDCPAKNTTTPAREPTAEPEREKKAPAAEQADNVASARNVVFVRSGLSAGVWHWMVARTGALSPGQEAPSRFRFRSEVWASIFVETKTWLQEKIRLAVSEGWQPQLDGLLKCDASLFMGSGAAAYEASPFGKNPEEKEPPPPAKRMKAEESPTNLEERLSTAQKMDLPLDDLAHEERGRHHRRSGPGRSNSAPPTRAASRDQQQIRQRSRSRPRCDDVMAEEVPGRGQAELL